MSPISLVGKLKIVYRESSKFSLHPVKVGRDLGDDDGDRVSHVQSEYDRSLSPRGISGTSETEKGRRVRGGTYY